MTYLPQIEALLFVAGEEGLSLRQLANLTNLSPTALQQQVDKLKEKYENDQDSALCLIESSQTFKLVTKDAYAELLRTFANAPINQSLSRASLEVLSIIAYKQPITRLEIDDIRGVNSSGALSKLIAFELVKETGKKEVIGRPNLYATTDYFLDYMGINHLDELLDVSNLEIEDQETALFHNND
ncbi:segregation and condensation protein B [Streptococcus bovimastitidis]|uniref:Segregation and condensation protein B n=1 Tax=Streptococcus bovimastitidis TaxID=1856638 RepID=A0A1L8MQ97_9STRE|nr:SMC-Scp complex subunit ScpB [Streptococcus bovimastitidis]OJF72909.1 segregation and condensation protein B [Streptococcus bovimastitidis]